MIIRAELKCKQTGCEADPCAVDKVIELPSPQFQQFSRALLADYDFIAENKNAIRHDDDSRHCLLILDAEGTDGFLVDPQGYNYARYSAFVPNARSLLTPDMGIDRSYLSPAEPWRDESRAEMLRMTLRVEGKLDYTLVLPADEEYLDAVKRYALVKLYLFGRDVPPDREQAREWLIRAAAQGNAYARFFLDRFDQFRDPSVMLAATKLLHHMSRIFQSNSVPPSNPAGIRIDSKRRRRLMEKRMAMGHKADDHEEQTQYQQSM